MCESIIVLAKQLILQTMCSVAYGDCGNGMWRQWHVKTVAYGDNGMWETMACGRWHVEWHVETIACESVERQWHVETMACKDCGIWRQLYGI